MSTASDLVNQAKQRHCAGQWYEAEALYRRAIEVEPTHLEARMLLGVVCLAVDKLDPAVECFRYVLAQQPDCVDGYEQLATALGRQKKFAESLDCLRRCVELLPDSAERHYRLGLALAHLMYTSDAADCFRRAIALRADFAEAHFNLGLALRRLGDPAAAEICFRRTMQLAEEFLPARHHLAAVFDDQGKLDEAAECLAQVLAIRPDLVECHNNLGVVLTKLGRFDEGERCFRRAVELDPFHAEAQNNLGAALEREGRWDEAVATFRRALELQPWCANAARNLAAVLLAQGRTAEARQCYTQAAQQHLDEPIWELCAISVCPVVFDSAAEIGRYRGQLLTNLQAFTDRAPRLSLSSLEQLGGRPSFQLLSHGQNDRPIREQYAKIFQSAFPRRRPVGSAGRPRLGMVVTSGHEYGFYRSIGGVVEQMNRERFQLTLLATQSGRNRLRSLVKNDTIPILTLPDSLVQAAAMIEDQHFDVLYHWEIGTDNLNYFLAYFRLAPVQCTSWGVQSTSGIPTIDAYLSSAPLEPPDAQQYFSERLILADSLLLFQKRIGLPPSPKSREDFGFDAGQHVYLCAQRLEKLHPDFDAILSGILHADPAGLVVIVQSPHGEFVAEQLRERFRKHLGDGLQRVHFLPHLVNADYLSLMAASDVVLDPLHYGGVNTSYDAFALGKPVVTMPGAFQQGRYTMACYRMMGFTECIAADSEDYIRIAVELGTCADRRACVGRRIEQACEVLFEDPHCVSEHLRIFEELIDEARRRMAGA